MPFGTTVTCVGNSMQRIRYFKIFLWWYFLNIFMMTSYLNILQWLSNIVLCFGTITTKYQALICFVKIYVSLSLNYLWNDYGGHTCYRGLIHQFYLCYCATVWPSITEAILKNMFKWITCIQLCNSSYRHKCSKRQETMHALDDLLEICPVSIIYNWKYLKIKSQLYIRQILRWSAIVLRSFYFLQNSFRGICHALNQ